MMVTAIEREEEKCHSSNSRIQSSCHYNKSGKATMVRKVGIKISDFSTLPVECGEVLWLPL